MLKQATGDLVDQFGKQANAGHVLDKSQQTISKFCDTDTNENVITLPDVVRLEGSAREPSVTRLMCRLAGGRFVRTVDPALDDSGLSDAFMSCVKEVGDVADALREGRRDGKLDVPELTDQLTQWDELVDAALAGRAACQSALQRVKGEDVTPRAVKLREA